MSYMGRKIDVQNDQRAVFGAYMQGGVRNTPVNSVMDSRTRGRIFIDADGTHQRNMSCIDLGSGKLATVTSGVFMPTPDIAIERINGWKYNDNDKVSAHIRFMYNEKYLDDESDSDDDDLAPSVKDHQDLNTTK